MSMTMRYVGASVLMIAAVCVPRDGLSESRPSAAEIDRDVTAALASLYGTSPAAKKLGGEAKGILGFPTVAKAGFMFAGEFGVGALRKQGGSKITRFQPGK